ncbi:hypothetical protein [Herbaspirillum huttiense]|uniref:Uncharacterized protein n=1 Tax=Herbaspirillum huttiense subsp. lycopersici TaxID=3074428 RepID=A0ABU2EG26_9BURK|nr:hypothetical protein [Herbaspirillum huttiense]MDR9847093.1 hypothetical protein [Herbaspirillum huttiense SE1]
MSLLKVTKFQAVDGSLHDTAKAAELQNGKLRLAPVLDAYLAAQEASGALDPSEGQRGVVHAFVLEHAGDLRELLNETLPERRGPSKNKAEKAAARDANAANAEANQAAA